MASADDWFQVATPDGGHLWMTSADAHRYLSRLRAEGPRGYEPLTAATWWCLATTARVIIDIGAHVGYYALLAGRAAPAAAVHAAEPLREAADLLDTTAARNGLTITVHRVALGAVAGRTRLQLPATPANPVPTTATTAGDRARAASPPGPTRVVDVTTLDTLLRGGRDHVDLVKLDVEGSEREVLTGGRHTIAAHRPDILMEVAVDDDTSFAALAWLRSRGYRIHDLTPTGPTPIAPEALPRIHNQRRSTTRRYGEVLASTRSHAALRALATAVTRLRWPAR